MGCFLRHGRIERNRISGSCGSTPRSLPRFAHLGNDYEGRSDA